MLCKIKIQLIVLKKIHCLLAQAIKHDFLAQSRCGYKSNYCVKEYMNVYRGHVHKV